MTGIHYLTDESGKRIAVQIDLQKYSRLWEDFEDALLAKKRLKERRTPLAEVERELFGKKRAK